VALARALAVEPSILLLDEPFAALDRNLRLDMQIEVKRLQRQFGITAILVTHDQEEAMSLSDRIAVMQRGRVEQFASPVEVYDTPRTLFVNSFVGTANLLPGEIVGREGDTIAITLDAGATLTLPRARDVGGKRVIVSARPENLRLHAAAAPGRWPVDLRIRMPVGAQTVSEAVTRDGQSLKVTEPRAALAAPGDASGALFCEIVSPAAVSLFPAPDAEPAHA
jgi:putative spermidine/putrescine transport system ATP-binding protein